MLTIVNKTPEDSNSQAEPEALKQQYSFRKRKMLIDKKKRQSKLVKAIITISESFNKNNTELTLIGAQYDLNIPILRTYKKAINNTNYNRQ